ncbi:MAG: YtxH domain-containing protein [Chloroflexi bacterium]|nr:YtxH domain-containing protein [Chloroflexota bacterium]
MADNDNFGSFLIGFVVGGITGALVALLYAPQTGEETRTVIKEKAIELKDKTVDSLDDTYKKAELAATDAVTKAQELIKAAKEKGLETPRGNVLLEEKAPVKPKKSVA